MTVNLYYQSGSAFPFNASFGNGIGGNFLIGGCTGDLWSWNTGFVSALTVPTGAALESRINYIYQSGTNILASNAGYGILILNTGSTSINGISLTGIPFIAAASGFSDYAITVSGSAFNSANAPVTGTNIPIGFPFWPGNAQTESATFYGFRGLSGNGSITFSSSGGASGTYYSNVSGMLVSLCLSYSPETGSQLIGGFSPHLFTSGGSAFCINESSPAVMLTFQPNISGGSISSWGQNTGLVSGLWNFVSSLTGVGLGASLGAAFATLSSAVVADATSGKLRAISYIGGSITQTQTAGISGIYPSVAIVSGTIALIPQNSTSNVLQYILSGTTWVASGDAITSVASPTMIISQGMSAAVCFSSGVNISQYNGSWSVVSSVGLSFIPTTISIDTSGNYFCAGNGSAALITSAGSLLASGTFGSGTIVGTASWSGNYWAVGTGIIWGLAYQPWSGVLSLQTSAVLTGTQWLQYLPSETWNQASGAVSLSGALWYTDTLYCPSSSGIVEFEVTSPYTLKPRRAGAIVSYANSVYSNFSGLGLGNIPCQFAIDASGNPRVFTLQGNMITLGASGTVSSISQLYSGGQGGITQAVSATGGFIWGATSMAPMIVQTT